MKIKIIPIKDGVQYDSIILDFADEFTIELIEDE